MLARSRQVQLPSGATVRTPLLMPSVSSRGFGLRADGLSEVVDALAIARDHLTESLLVSAYDLHHRLLPDVEGLLGGDHWSTAYAVPELLAIDSGGYELGSAWDGNEIYREPRLPRGFAREDYEAILSQLPRDRDLLIVTYDHVEDSSGYPSIGEQIARARALVAPHPHLMLDLLLKPEGMERYVDPEGLAAATGELTDVHVIGVTEKELGGSLLDKLEAVAELRRLLDDAGVEAPLHVFGALSLVHASLYCMAGAEVLDGLDWLRYGHHRGMSVHSETAAVLDGLLEEPPDLRRAMVMLDYLGALGNLKRRLRLWIDSGGDFSVMEELAHVCESAHRAMRIRIAKGT